MNWCRLGTRPSAGKKIFKFCFHFFVETPILIPQAAASSQGDVSENHPRSLNHELHICAASTIYEGGFSKIKPNPKGSISFDPYVGLVIGTVNQI